MAGFEVATEGGYGIAMSKEITLVLVEDHTLIREGLRVLIEKVDDVTIVGEAGDGREALLLIKKLQPRIALIDITLPLLNGIEVVSHVRRESPHVRSLILSAHSDEQHVLAALRAGASGYMTKDSTPAEFEMGIRAAFRGEVYLSPRISEHVVTAYLSHTNGESGNELTFRQKEILQLVAEGCTTKEIAAILNIASKTVETHRIQLMERTGVQNLAGLIRYAIRNGIVPN